jgi:hypothetical protein
MRVVTWAMAIHPDCVRLGRPGGAADRSEPEHVTSVDEGMGVLAASDNKIEKRSIAKDGPKRSTPATKKPRASVQQGHVGESLRSIYQQTVDEKVPDEFLDILGKLA